MIPIPRAAALILALALTAGCRGPGSRAERQADRHMRRAPLGATHDRVTLSFTGSPSLRLNRPGVSVTLSPSVSPADVGVPFFPGARPRGEQHILKEQTPGGETVSAIVNLKSDASFHDVTDFYRGHLGPRTAVKDLRPLGRRLLTIESSAPARKTAVTVKSVRGGTHITIISKKNSEKNPSK